MHYHFLDFPVSQSALNGAGKERDLVRVPSPAPSLSWVAGLRKLASPPPPQGPGSPLECALGAGPQPTFLTM